MIFDNSFTYHSFKTALLSKRRKTVYIVNNRSNFLFLHFEMQMRCWEVVYITIPVIVWDAMLNLNMKSPTSTISIKYVKTRRTWVPVLFPYPRACKLIENEAKNVYTKQTKSITERTSRSQNTPNQESGMMTYSANFPRILNRKQNG